MKALIWGILNCGKGMKKSLASRSNCMMERGAARPRTVSLAMARVVGAHLQDENALVQKHLITHKSFAEFLGVLEAGGEIRHSLQALPDGFDSGFAVAFARQESAEHGDQAHDLIQTR